MADKLIGSIFTRAKNAQARSYATTSKNVARLMLIFRRTIDALTDAVATGEEPIEALDASVGWNTLLKASPEVATIAATASLAPLTGIGREWCRERWGQYEETSGVAE